MGLLWGTAGVGTPRTCGGRPQGKAGGTAAAAATPFTRLGLIDSQGAVSLGLAVHGLDGRLGLGVAAHLDKAEALAAAGVAVLDDLRAADGAVLREPLLEVRARHTVLEIANV
jgi:hypothetical protein